MNQREESRVPEVVGDVEGLASSASVAQPLGIRVLREPAPSLPSRYYVDPAIYERERERLFFAKWLCAGRQEEWAEPGDYALRDVAGESVIVVRDKVGKIHAFYNVCRHRGSVLCESARGRFPRHGITCPYHAWTYGFDGRLQGTPYIVGMPDFRKADYPLYAVHVAPWGGFVWLNLAADPPPLSAELGGLWTHFARYNLETLRRARRIEYDIVANWKLLVENFGECYHCPTIHPELNRGTPYLGGGSARLEGEAAWRGGAWMDLADGFATLTIRGEARRPTLPGLAPEDRRRVYYNTVYPNLFLSLHPDYVLTHTLWPAGPDRTRIVCEWLFPPDVMAMPGFDPSDAVEFWDLTNKQDWHVCELAQRGNRSRAHVQGVHVGQEAGPQYFNRYYLATMGNPPPEGA
jgi:Rieske 2Fe-2S family protein